MDHKYKSLFRDMNINFVMTEIGMKPIYKLLSLNYTNFFIMGNLKTIKHVLGMKCDFIMSNLIDSVYQLRIFPLENLQGDRFNNPFKWYGLTHEFGNLPCCCGTFNMILIRPSHFFKAGYVEDMVNFLINFLLKSLLTFLLPILSFISTRLSNPENVN